MAVRFALGARRGRIVRQLLTESLLLSAAGGVLGIFFAQWVLVVIGAFVEANLEGPSPISPGIDTRVLLFTAAVAVPAHAQFSQPGTTPTNFKDTSMIRPPAGSVGR